ncbi:bifunctional indole-3-glycerol phosphate synthase/phosphoribosylanthranilate isomerase, partial [Pseudoalteromonas issachenkonii]
DYLEFVRRQVGDPLICNDFFIDEYEVYMARIYGGDAILLMLSVLDDESYKALHAVAESLNMSVLTEVSNQEEVHRAHALD